MKTFALSTLQGLTVVCIVLLVSCAKTQPQSTAAAEAEGNSVPSTVGGLQLRIAFSNDSSGRLPLDHLMARLTRVEVSTDGSVWQAGTIPLSDWGIIHEGTQGQTQTITGIAPDTYRYLYVEFDSSVTLRRPGTGCQETTQKWNGVPAFLATTGDQATRQGFDFAHRYFPGHTPPKSFRSRIEDFWFHYLEHPIAIVAGKNTELIVHWPEWLDDAATTCESFPALPYGVVGSMNAPNSYKLLQPETTVLDGKWTSNCYGKSQNEYWTETRSFKGSEERVFLQAFSDDQCRQNKTLSIELLYSFRLGKEVPGITAAREFDHVLRQGTITPSLGKGQAFNDYTQCGLDSWQDNQSISVTKVKGTEPCLGIDLPLGLPVYSIYTLKSGILKFGDLPEAGGRKPSERADAVNLRVSLVKSLE